ncbi:hypothetical protein OIU74_019684 [Salix koriyanagi]|uniref:Uncharacterized protein n=1 Tax=Salix koriyanagi TaxID=2511006 RepID=A0A9Q0P4V3_9ROSI|nr:hypothetical protein OIU74_019684 [Salix koriyanagi]
MAYHFRLDFNLIEGFAVVDTNDTADHFRYYDHVAKVSPHWFWFLTRWSIPFLFKKSQSFKKHSFQFCRDSCGHIRKNGVQTSRDHKQQIDPKQHR